MIPKMCRGYRLAVTVLALTLSSCGGGGGGRSENTGAAPQPVKGALQGYGPPGGTAGPPPELAPKK
jgi:hypothetical protein